MSQGIYFKISFSSSCRPSSKTFIIRLIQLVVVSHQFNWTLKHIPFKLFLKVQPISDVISIYYASTWRKDDEKMCDQYPFICSVLHSIVGKNSICIDESISDLIF